MILAYLNSLKNEKSLTIKDISQRSGIPESTIKRIFDGTTPEPRITTAAQIVKAMGGSLDEMMGFKPISQSDVLEDNSKILDALQMRVEQNASMIDILKKSRYISLALNLILAIAIIIISVV